MKIYVLGIKIDTGVAHENHFAVVSASSFWEAEVRVRNNFHLGKDEFIESVVVVNQCDLENLFCVF